MTDILTADNLNNVTAIRHAFFTRAWGNGGFSLGNTQEAVVNRGRMAAYFRAAPQNLLTCHQTHSPDVVTVTDVWPANDNASGDALVTDRPGLVLGVLTADCVPILFADARAGVIGAAHAGWRGAVGGIIDNTLAAMENRGARRGSIVAALGPCIGQASYEVGPEFPAPFMAEDALNEKYFRPAFKSDHYMFDLPGYVVGKLKNLGVGSVEGSPADTCADPQRFFSHRYSTLRGEKREGNLLSAIMLNEKNL